VAELAEILPILAEAVLNLVTGHVKNWQQSKMLIGAQSKSIENHSLDLSGTDNLLTSEKR
jgi:hypothetical protein